MPSSLFSYITAASFGFGFAQIESRTALLRSVSSPSFLLSPHLNTLFPVRTLQPMEASSRDRSSNGTTFHSHFHRSLSPSGRFFPSSISASSASSFTPRPDPEFTRSTSPTRVTLGRSVSPSSSVRLAAPRRHPIASHHQKQSHHSLPKKTCMCSPTTHPGSFRCSLHKNSIVPGYAVSNQTSSCRSSHQLNMRRSAMTNSLVRIGTVEGDLVRRALAALIRPSSHSLRRRHDFQPRPSRLSVMSKAEDL